MTTDVPSDTGPNQTPTTLDGLEALEKTLRQLTAHDRTLSDDVTVRLAGVQKDLLATKLEAERFAWQRAVHSREMLQKWATGMATAVVALLIAWWGKGIVQDLKPVHLETGTVSTAARDAECTGRICDNVVRKSRILEDAPVDARGDRCRLRGGVNARNDRLTDVGEEYYLSSDFVTDYVQDPRCFRQVSLHVPAHFSKTPVVTTQISWLDALPVDSTNDGTPIFERVSSPLGSTLIPKPLNVRIETLVKNVTTEGFDIVIRTWYDSRIYRADVSYTAFIQ